MELLTLLQKVKLEKLLVACGIKECTHKYSHKKHCFVCQDNLSKKDLK